MKPKHTLMNLLLLLCPSPPIRAAVMATPPDLNIPPSTATVDVSIINTGSFIRGINTWRFIEPSIAGHDWLATPCYSFYIRHPTLNRSLVFDLGVKRDWWNLPPPLLRRFESSRYTLVSPTSVRDILEGGGVNVDTDIEALVWSHAHFDHTGDPSTFPPHVSLIVGPGVKDKLMPGYPDVPDAAFQRADVEGRKVREVDFQGPGSLRISRFGAVDYFGDGSFYLLDSPGHALGHVCGLARVTAGEDGSADSSSFILMGGDALHHGGELRPHTWHPLPAELSPNPFTGSPNSTCPGEMFENVLPNGTAQPFYVPSKPATVPPVHYDIPAAIQSIRKLQEVDAHDNVLVVAAHDESILGVVDFFPETANRFVEKRWVREARWAFLRDFAGAVGYEGVIVGKNDFSPLGLRGDGRSCGGCLV